MFNYGVFVCFLLGVFTRLSHSLKFERRFIRNVSYDNILPSHTSYYITFFESISRTDCALQCILLKSACAGILYNNKLFSCKLLKCHLNERSIDRKLVDFGWEFWFQNNVCPVGWVPFNGHCYILNKTKDNWKNAKEQCEQYQAYLVEIDTSAENTWIMETFLLPWNKVDCRMWYYCCESWIGATDIDNEGIFTWNHHTNITYSNWMKGQPDNTKMGHCVSFCRNGKWDDENCKTRYVFICEKEQ